MATKATVPKLTPARAAALEVLYRAPGTRARESNQTTHADGHGRPCIYWQTRAWLSTEKLIATVPGSRNAGWWELTADGLDAAERTLYPQGRGR
jgi:hypothetical protein